MSILGIEHSDSCFSVRKRTEQLVVVSHDNRSNVEVVKVNVVLMVVHFLPGLNGHGLPIDILLYALLETALFWRGLQNVIMERILGRSSALNSIYRITVYLSKIQGASLDSLKHVRVQRELNSYKASSHRQSAFCPGYRSVCFTCITHDPYI